MIVNTAGVTTFTATPVGGGNIYNFKTIQIAAGATLRLSGQVFATPLYFLAQGAVTVAGTIDLSGKTGGAGDVRSTHRTHHPWRRRIRRGRGCLRGKCGAAGTRPGRRKFHQQVYAVIAGYYQIQGGWGGPGGFTGNQFLVPLLGGSGGAGSGTSGVAGVSRARRGRPSYSKFRIHYCDRDHHREWREWRRTALSSPRRPAAGPEAEFVSSRQ